MSEHKTANKNKVYSKETEIALISSVFADMRGLIVGAVLQIAVMVVFIVNTGLYWLSFFPLSVLLVTFWRQSLGRKFNEAVAALDPDDIEARLHNANYWVNRYLVPGTITGANIGFFCFFGLQVSESAFSFSAAYCLLFTPLPTIVGRIYGSLRVASFTLFGMFGPLMIGYLIRADVYHIFLALLCVPYMVLVMGMVKNVRSTVAKAVTGNNEKIELGRRFDVALTNMTHGLMMLDDENRVLIMNDRAVSLFGVPEHLDVMGRPLSVLMRYTRRFEDSSTLHVRKLGAALEQVMDTDIHRKLVSLDDGRYIELFVNERTVEGTVLTFEDVTERILSAQKIERMAQYDALTGLPNRQHFMNLVEQIIATSDSSSSCALLVVDVDDFKYVNDAIGHTQGDVLLRSVANNLQTVMGPTDVACRLGGDEFLLFLGNLDSPASAAALVPQLSARLTGIYDLEVEQIHASCSIGYYVDRPDRFSLDLAIIRADLALYSVKNSQKGGWACFEQAMDEQYQRRQQIKKKLGNAIQNQELSLVFQPLVDVTSGRLVACEALARWYDKDFGQVSPAEFIPLAEEMGVIGQITDQMLHRATLECAKWPEHVSVSVNLSTVDFRTGDILGMIDSALALSGLPAHRLEVEVTETAVSSNEKEMVEKLHAIHERGVRISLDDFGTGYSSLSYLHRLPLDKVKIDRSFVVGIDTGETPVSLLRGITDLCATLNLDVTVEGVETISQMELVVHGAKVDRIQGFIYGPGLPASGINTLANLKKVPLQIKEQTA